MLEILWNTRGYFFWLLVVSGFCLALERIAPWRRQQRLWRRQFGQDLFWLVFNGHYAGLLISHVAAALFSWAAPATKSLEGLNLLAGAPLAIQFATLFILKDLMEWGIHNLLHRVPLLWAFHKVHHSIEELDWIGNFRFHWMEIVVYRGLTYLPLVVLGVDGRVILWLAILTTLIGHLNHSNLNITWGPLRYVINSPRMHVWHHDYAWPAGREKGVNFGISFSVWDWLFGTAWWPDKVAAPAQQPDRLGFPGIATYPRGLMTRLLYPLSALWRPPSSSSAAPRR
ncbi:MAG: sterol desaturase family protein [Planctomycetota bacterium]